jgi:eukaryotic-like serine/threonine-protein kinase
LIVANADRIIELLHEAKARPAGAERERLLAEACGDDAALKEQIVSLLKADADEGKSDFLKNTLLIRPTLPVTEKPGDRIGRYKLLEQIGEGGCGVVYMAEQEEPVRRRVALKVIKLGMDTKQVIARFEAERQALAMMDHPNIAKVLDAGATNTGRPFFVMELVRGIKITDYCDQNNLSTNERLELFIQVCQAIQHAHQKGIIHRDIKPSNILVTQHDDVAVPKVIDFGIAKATIGHLTDKTLFTAFAQFMGTPAYMSPEQAQMSGLDIDTRADIYSLGVLLYELLTGNTPFDAKALLAAGMDEMCRKIREDEPSRPSICLSTMLAMDLTIVAKHRHVEPPRLIHLLRGDLDWLVMKCLEKDRTRRYATANALAMDLQRHLNDEPVVACPPSRSYRFQKLVRRNKLAFAAAAVVLLVLLVGIAASTWEAVRATRAEREQTRLREQAESARRNEARERAKAEANETRAESEAAKSQQVAQFLQDMLKSVGPSVALGRDTTMVREILDQTAQRLNDLKAQPAVEADLRSTLGNIYSDLGEYTNAVAMHREALAIRKKLGGGEHAGVATSLNDLAETLYRQGKPPEAEGLHREALALRQKLFGSEHPYVAQSLNSLAEVLRRQGKANFPESERLHREALAIRRKLLGDGHPDTAQSLHNLGFLLNDQGKSSEAEEMLRAALAMRRKLLGPAHPDIALTLDRLGLALERGGKNAESEKVHREALAMRRQLFGKEHPDVAHSLNNLGRALRNQRKYAEAEATYREALAMRRKLLDKAHPDLFSTLRNLGVLLQDQRKLSEAETLFRELFTLSSTAGLNDLERVLRAQGKLSELESLYRELVAMQRKSLGNEHADVAYYALNRLGDMLRERGKWVEAEEVIREALAMRRKLLGNEHPDTALMISALAKHLRSQSKLVEAESLARESLAIMRKLLPGDDPKVAQSLFVLASVLGDQGKWADLETLMRDELATRQQREHPDAILMLNQLGLALQKQGRLQESEATQREALASARKVWANITSYILSETFERLIEVLTAEGKLAEVEVIRRELLTTWVEKPFYQMQNIERLANLLTLQGRPAEAESLCREAEPLYREELSIRKKQYGEAHREVDNALGSLARVLQQAGKLAEAEAVRREELALEKKLSGEEHPFVANSLSDLAYVLRDSGKWSEAEAVYREALDMRRKLLGNSDPAVASSLSRLGATLSVQGKHPEAEAVYREALALRRKLPADDPQLAAVLAGLTSTLLAEQKFAEAEPPVRECLTIREKKLPDDWQTFNARRLLGASLLGQKKFAEAEPLLLSGYEGMKQREDKIPASSKRYVKETLQRVVQLYEATGQSQKAAEWNKKLAEFDQAEAGKKAAAAKP